jgi:tRNA-2-methylthio-N6-dimethylallyladenosine synthase
MDIVRVGEQDFPPRKVWMKTYGCQMNEHDTQRILSLLKPLNFSQTADQQEADLVLFNTCAIRDLSNMKFYSHLGETKRLKNEKKVVIGVGGCVAQTEGKELVKKYPQLDFAFGTDVIDQIPDMVYRTYAGDNKFVINSWDRSQDYSIETKLVHGEPRAMVNIIKGCNKCCSYCIVPFTRGKERSRKIEEVVKDVERLVRYQGIQEIMLLGQNVNSFGHDNKEKFVDLLKRLEDIEGLHLIRYTTSHPYDVSDELIEWHGKSKKLSRHLHLPVQSGSTEVLKKMRREYSVEHYLGLLEKLRAAKPDIVLSTDIIVGFPNETDEQFQMTLDLLDKAQYDFCYSYAFSKRNRTRAAFMEDILTDEIRGERLRHMQKHQLLIQEKLRKQMEGKTYRVLVDGSSNMKGIFKWKGRTNCSRIIHFVPPESDKDYKWHWVDLKVTSATALSCQGELVRDHGKSYTPLDSDVL